MISDIENIDILLGGNHFERGESEPSTSVRRPRSSSYNTLVNSGLNPNTNPREDEIRNYTEHGHDSGGTETSSEYKRLSGELNKRTTQEMNDLTSSVSSQIQRAMSEAITEQALL